MHVVATCEETQNSAVFQTAKQIGKKTEETNSRNLIEVREANEVPTSGNENTTNHARTNTLRENTTNKSTHDQLRGVFVFR